METIRTEAEVLYLNFLAEDHGVVKTKSRRMILSSFVQLWYALKEKDPNVGSKFAHAASDINILLDLNNINRVKQELGFSHGCIPEIEHMNIAYVKTIMELTLEKEGTYGG